MTINIFNQLPDDLLRIIVSYDDRFKYRNGHWIDQIPKDDYRYNAIKNINRRIESKHAMISFIVIGSECHLTIFWGPITVNKGVIDYYYRFVKSKHNEIYKLK
jgi:hypothetical protein